MTLPSLVDLSDRSLVPGASGDFVRVVSAAQIREQDARGVLVEKLRTLWNPAECPASELPLLAWAWSVDIWDDGWPETRKRAVIAESRAYHERKTTLAGYRMALGYRDAELLRANLPRHGFFVGYAPTQESHDRWLAGLPEIRIYARTPDTRAGGKGFFASRSIARSLERVLWDRRRAELIRNGVVTPLILSGLVSDADGRILPEPERLLIPDPPKRVMRAGGFVGWPVSSGEISNRRVVTPALSGAAGVFTNNSVQPSLTPVEVSPIYVAEPRPAGLGFYASRSQFHRGVRVNDAEQGFYTSFRLADGSQSEPGVSRMRNRLNRTRLRRDAYTAGLLVHAPRAPVPSVYPRGRVARTGPDVLVASLQKAIVSASAARDTLFMDVNSLREATYGDLETFPDDARYGRAVFN